MNGVVLFFLGGVAMWHLEMASGVRGHTTVGVGLVGLVDFKVGHSVLSFDAKNAVIRNGIYLEYPCHNMVVVAF